MVDFLPDRIWISDLWKRPPATKIFARLLQTRDKLSYGRIAPMRAPEGAPLSHYPSCVAFPIHKAIADLRVGEHHPHDVTFLLRNSIEIDPIELAGQGVPGEDIEAVVSDVRRGPVVMHSPQYRNWYCVFGRHRLCPEFLVCQRHDVI